MNLKIITYSICLVIIALKCNLVSSLDDRSNRIELILTKYIERLINARHSNGMGSSSSSTHSEGIVKQKNDSSVPLPDSSYFINELFNNTDTISIKGIYLK